MFIPDPDLDFLPKAPDPGSEILKNYTDFVKSVGSGWTGPGCRSGSGDMMPVRIHNTVQA
jgi:hypothetical protein